MKPLTTVFHWLDPWRHHGHLSLGDHAFAFLQASREAAFLYARTMEAVQPLEQEIQDFHDGLLPEVRVLKEAGRRWGYELLFLIPN